MAIFLKRQNIPLETALPLFEEKCKPILREYQRHEHFSPKPKRKVIKSKHASRRDSKGRKVR